MMEGPGHKLGSVTPKPKFCPLYSGPQQTPISLGVCNWELSDNRAYGSKKSTMSLVGKRMNVKETKPIRNNYTKVTTIFYETDRCITINNERTLQHLNALFLIHVKSILPGNQIRKSINMDTSTEKLSVLFYSNL